MTPRETENNAYAKFWGDKQRALWYVMVFSGVVNSQNDIKIQAEKHRVGDTINPYHCCLTSKVKGRSL